MIRFHHILNRRKLMSVATLVASFMVLAALLTNGAAAEQISPLKIYDFYTETELSVVITSGQAGAVFAQCNKGDMVVGGGFNISRDGVTSEPAETIFNNHPSGPDEWMVVVKNHANSDIRVRAYAICAKLSEFIWIPERLK